MYSISYVSRAVPSFSQDDFDKIVEVATVKNKNCGVTGIMLFHGGHFFQYLEGDKNNVMDIMAKILCDTRHYCVLIRSRGDIEERVFPNWSMRCKDLENGEIEFLEKAYSWDQLVEPDSDQKLHEFVIRNILTQAKKLLA